MRVKDIMTGNPVCCTPDMKLQQVAQMMVECDCGAIPVVDSNDSKKPLGIVTDRDIVMRTLAKGRNPMDMTVSDVMTSQTVTVSEDSSLTDAARLMEENQIRRLIVTDGSEQIIGMLAQADIAREGQDFLTGEIVEEISEPVSRSHNRSMQS